MKLVDFHTHTTNIGLGDGGSADAKSRSPRCGVVRLHERTGFRAPTSLALMKLLRRTIVRDLHERVSAATPAGLRLAMNNNGVSHACVFPVEPFDDTPAFAAAVSAVPGLIPFASVSPTDSLHVDKANRYAKAGFRGLKLHPILQRTAPTDRRYFDIVDAWSQSERCVVFHTGEMSYTAQQTPASRFGRLEHFAPIVRAFPKVAFVLGHMGLMTPDHAIELAERFPNVWLETSFQSARTIARAIDRIGVHRIVLGSDWPCTHQTGMKRVVRTLLAWRPELAEPLLHANAERLIGPLEPVNLGGTS